MRNCKHKDRSIGGITTAEFAASIAGLASTAEVVFTRIYRYIKQAKNAKREILELFAEVNGLYGTLKSVSLIIDDFHSHVGVNVITDPRQIVACGSALDRLRDKLGQFQENNATKTKIVRKE